MLGLLLHIFSSMQRIWFLLSVELSIMLIQACCSENQLLMLLMILLLFLLLLLLLCTPCGKG